MPGGSVVSIQTISSSTVTARKDHQCSTCSAVAIKAGDTYERYVNVSDGRIYTWRNCFGCAAIANEVWYWAGCPDEGYDGETCLEWAREALDDPKWSERARGFIARYGAEVTS